jgi:hypothetical protein
MNFNVTKWNRQRYLNEAENPENWDDANLAAKAIDNALEADQRTASLLPAELAKAFIIVARNGFQDELYKDFQVEMVKQLRSVLEEIKTKSTPLSSKDVALILQNYVDEKYPASEYNINVYDADNYVGIGGFDKGVLDNPELEKLTGYKIFSDQDEDRGYIVRFYPPQR